MIQRRDVFQAIADPTRRAIIGLLAKEPVRVNHIAEQFDVSRQAISLHLKILAECGLIHIHQQGRERYCEVKLEQLDEVAEWVQQYQKVWTSRINNLKKFLETEPLQLKAATRKAATSKLFQTKSKKNGNPTKK